MGKNRGLKIFSHNNHNFTINVDLLHYHRYMISCDSTHQRWSLTVTGSSNGVSISACRRKTFPRHTLHNILSNAGIFSRTITPATNLQHQVKLTNNSVAKIRNYQVFLKKTKHMHSLSNAFYHLIVFVIKTAINLCNVRLKWYILYMYQQIKVHNYIVCQVFRDSLNSTSFSRE